MACDGQSLHTEGIQAVTVEVVRPGAGVSAARPLPVVLDEMTVGEFLDFLRWWAALTSGERQEVLAAHKHTRH
jgi:hypothetical protein